jgi:hypothetical protein
MDNHSVCSTCGLLNEEGQHPLTTDCIKALRIAMLKQKASAESIGMDISIHFLRALEELSIRPDVGFRYTFMNPETGDQEELPPQQVSGIFASLLRVYRQQSDFKPDEEQQRLATHWSAIAGKIGGMLHQFMEKHEVSEEDKIVAMALLEAVAIDDGTGPTVKELQEELGKEQALTRDMERTLKEVYAYSDDGDLSVGIRGQVRKHLVFLEHRSQGTPDPESS